MKVIKKITNGIVIVTIGIIHTQIALSADGFGNQFKEFSKSHFFNLFGDIDNLRALADNAAFEPFAAFWFFPVLVLQID